MERRREGWNGGDWKEEGLREKIFGREIIERRDIWERKGWWKK